MSVDSSVFVAVRSVGELSWVVLKQQSDEGNNAIYMDFQQFSALMLQLTSLEKRLMDDENRKQVNDAVNAMVNFGEGEVLDIAPPPAKIAKTTTTKPNANKQNEKVLNVYAKLFSDRFLPALREKCVGCCMGNYEDLSLHEVCSGKKIGERIELVFETVDATITNTMIEQKLCEEGSFNGKVDKQDLVKNVNSKRKLFSRIEKRCLHG